MRDEVYMNLFQRETQSKLQVYAECCVNFEWSEIPEKVQQNTYTGLGFEIKGNFCFDNSLMAKINCLLLKMQPHNTSDFELD
jgi:hypothetical protein